MAQQRRSLSSFSSTAAMRNIQRDLHGTRMKLAVTPINTSSAQLQLQQHAAKAAADPAAGPEASSEQIMEAGTTVSVRTRVGKLPGGRQLVLWLSAVVVSAAEEGYLTVVYKGDFPPGDPFQTVRVARKDTKKITAGAAAAAAATITDPAAAAARPSSNNVAAPAPRPSTGGKKVRVLKRIYPEAF
ncbi:hypothetical protein OsI_12660 [Oryza sativa Indica Group]|uniref:Uncharacterized protein n=1 Tax=Oryza sativa subsp. indica TaxID=39946 RepID=B8AML8_ORYSI|nr:hypothetical protein OsI_12660 [Oryza sativa Indica Group]KAF2940288.1 hypothetical protein DAI22_03g260800 [Oryza sativa Japonica Group]